jgi:hypothetical protein
MEHVTQARIYVATLNQYRKWAKITGRNLIDLMNIALLFALRKQSEVEREIALKLEPYKKGKQ